MSLIINYTCKDNDKLNYLSERVLKKIKAEESGNFQDPGRLESIENYLKEIVEEEKIIISQKEVSRLAREIYEDSYSFGPISFLINDDRVTEIMINNFDEVYVEENDIVKKTGIIFRDNNHIKNLVDKILSPLGLRVDESSPMVDARLRNGSRINVVLSPVTVNDVVVTIRKFKRNIMDIKSLKREGTINDKIAHFIEICVKSKLNIIVSGATSTGKTTFLNVISNFIYPFERIVTIEETLELNLNLPHVVKLESRPPNIEGRGEITIRDLVRNSLRMRPDRIIVGEIRGAEAVDVLQAMNTGHSGSMTTVHSNSPEDLISRLETMILMSGLNLDPATARRMIASSIDMIIHLGRLKNGKRILLNISEIVDKSESMGSSATLEVKDIFKYQVHDFIKDNNEKDGSQRDDGRRDDDRIIHGSINCTGYIPEFTSKITDSGFDFDFGDENNE
ncbi:MAG: CpaF family protein [Actinomycetota bacterium]|jgi:pilus assembly protein CpaF|nr:CpaF family protein [Actinomycetota bacterium]